MQKTCTPPAGPGDHDFAGALERLTAQLDDRPVDGGGPVGELTEDLRTAYEELRVADEEIRTQQDEIGRLAESRHLERWQQERMLGALPVPVITTDAQGLVRAVNAAAVVLLRSRVARLLGKPVFAFFRVDDRAGLRRSLAGRAHGADLFHTRATLVVAGGSEVEVDVFASGDAEPGAPTTWLLLRTLPSDDPTPLPGYPALPQALVDLAALAVRADDLQELLDQAVAICSRALGEGAALSVNTGDPAWREALASTATLAQQVDGLQLRLGEGPCLDAFGTNQVVVSQDLHADARWPRLRAELPPQARAAVVVPVGLAGERIGAFSAYLSAASAGPAMVEVCDLLAATVGAAVHELEVRAELEKSAAEMRQALQSRATIDQAKGIVMAHRGGTPEEAFAHLVHLSSTQNAKLRDVAAGLVRQAADQAR
jgi:PAS domain-containing protein